jgi:hypothetical protein
MVGGYNLARGWSEDGTLPDSLIRETFMELGLSGEWIANNEKTGRA